jgi:cephalosporin hydroxylase
MQKRMAQQREQKADQQKKYMEHNLSMRIEDVLWIIEKRTMHESRYFGIQTYKCPFDMWVYQEILYDTHPNVIIEIGNAHGGSTLALAHLCDLFDRGRLIGVDITHDNIDKRVFAHPRITLIEGDACAMFDRVSSLVAETDKVLIIEDSSHTYENTLNVLRTYSRLVKPGGYFIVEDSICHHGVNVGPNPGPYEAIETFVRENRNFVVDRSKESFFITWNPKGYLKRV